MAGTPTLDEHPVTRAVTAARDGLAAVSEQPLWALDDAATRAALADVVALESQLTELKTRLLTHGRDVEVEAASGARSPGHWLAHVTRQTRREALAAQHLAERLERHPITREALARGEVRADQARVICDAVDALPSDLPDPALVAVTEKELVHLAGEWDAIALARLGRRILEVVDPVNADAHEARLLEAQEREASRRTTLRLTDRGDGTHDLRGRIPDLHADILHTALTAIASPRHVNGVAGAGSYDHQRPTTE